MNNNEENTPRIIHLKETNSTNAYLRNLLQTERLPEGSVVYVDFQTAGRGQLGNVWESEEGKNITFSVVIYPDVIPANMQFVISEIAALSVKETLDCYTDGCTVKWPNDVYWHDKKICGMLIENDLSGKFIYQSILGIGININQQIFRGDAPNPISLSLVTGKEYDRDEVLSKFLEIFYDKYLTVLKGDLDVIHKTYKAALYRGEGFYSYKDENGTFNACIHEIEPSGHMLLRLENGEIRRYAFKEVSVVL